MPFHNWSNAYSDVDRTATGGGFSWKANQFGLFVDTIIAHEVVLPNGDIITATNTTNADVHFALKVCWPVAILSKCLISASGRSQQLWYCHQFQGQGVSSRRRYGRHLPLIQPGNSLIEINISRAEQSIMPRNTRTGSSRSLKHS